jgi:hypothetical protein
MYLLQQLNFTLEMETNQTQFEEKTESLIHSSQNNDNHYS